MAFYLTGDFNNWRADDPAYRFTEVTSPYGGPRPDLTLASGGHDLETDLPAGLIQFKIVEDGSWERQWSVKRSGFPEQDISGDITADRFEAGYGLCPCYIVFRGNNGPHALFHYPGGRLRWDFHPASRTLTLHTDFQRAAGIQVRRWETFACGREFAFDTHVVLPYGYDPNGPNRDGLCLLFDDRSLIHGEDTYYGVYNQAPRQWPLVLDTLARHGLITPTVIIGIGVPWRRSDGRRFRTEAYLHQNEPLHQNFMDTLFDLVLPLARASFRVSDNPDLCTVAGHSNGGDVSLIALASRPNQLGGAVAVSPGNPALALSIPEAARARLRVSLAYASEDLLPLFLTRTSQVARPLKSSNLPHVIQYMPDATHDPASIPSYLPALFSFVLR